MIQILAASGLALSMLGMPVLGDPLVSDPPPTERIVIDLVTVNGSGCPAGTTAVAMAPDNTAFTVTYSDYLAQSGPGIKATESRKNCQLAVNVHVPSGFTYAVVQADYRGYGYLAKGATAREVASYYFQGMSQTNTATHSFSGPLDDNWQATDKTDIAAVSWAPCGEPRYLNINTELRVSAGAGATEVSFMSMDSTDATISTQYHFLWQKC
jgi:hypothetical protein